VCFLCLYNTHAMSLYMLYFNVSSDSIIGLCMFIPVLTRIYMYISCMFILNKMHTISHIFRPKTTWSYVRNTTIHYIHQMFSNLYIKPYVYCAHDIWFELYLKRLLLFKRVKNIYFLVHNVSQTF
jgi:hypothetical protein